MANIVDPDETVLYVSAWLGQQDYQRAWPTSGTKKTLKRTETDSTYVTKHRKAKQLGLEVIKLFSYSAQLSMKNFSANKYENANNSWYFHIY